MGCVGSAGSAAETDEDQIVGGFGWVSLATDNRWVAMSISPLYGSIES